jgi:hypothetical protein
MTGTGFAVAVQLGTATSRLGVVRWCASVIAVLSYRYSTFWLQSFSHESISVARAAMLSCCRQSIIIWDYILHLGARSRYSRYGSGKTNMMDPARDECPSKRTPKVRVRPSLLSSRNRCCRLWGMSCCCPLTKRKTGVNGACAGQARDKFFAL